MWFPDVTQLAMCGREEVLTVFFLKDDV
uniref:Uncharacterized protein n=1 Tax=Anguilla anguilla TaxID=7936 RepID=A0A0E9S9H8_ANGAN